MRVAIRSAGVVFTAIVSALFLAIASPMMTAQAATALMLGGIAAGELPDLVMSNVLSGRYANNAPGSPWSRVNVVWPAQARPYTGAIDLTLGQSIAEGEKNLNWYLDNTNGSITVVGMSAGALVVDEVLRDLANKPFRPGLTFVIVADSSRQQFINDSRYNSVLDYTYQPPPETPYAITVVTGEYDGSADFPDRPLNLLAVVNAMVGALYVHVPVMFANLNQVPAENITKTTNSVGGVTTHYLVPTASLPLVQLIPLLSPIEGMLKQIVDSGYSRNDPVAATSLAAAAVTTETQTNNSTLAVASAGSLAEPVKILAKENGALVGTTTRKDEEPDTATAGDAKKVSDLTDKKVTDLTDNNKVFQSITDEKKQAEGKLDTVTGAAVNGATDLTGGNKFSPSTTTESTESSSGVNTPSTTTATTTTTTTTTTKDNDVSTAQDTAPSTAHNDQSSGTSSSAGEGSTQ